MKISCLTEVFCPCEGAVSESHHLIRVCDPSMSADEQLRCVCEAVASLGGGRQMFRRFFLKDAASMQPGLEETLRSLPSCPTSIIGQAPLDGTAIAAWVYCVDGFGDGVSEHGISHNGYSHFWQAQMLSPGGDSHRQMDAIFRSYVSGLSARALTLSNDCIRTWIFVRDIDSNYGGVVVGRRDVFTEQGLTPQTHFVTSTGIEGSAADAAALVSMDAYAVGGLDEGQIRFLHAYDHLSPTALYGVTFERGTAVQYGDRQQVFISGTASIDSKGEVLHIGDVARQTVRMLENIDALLSEAGAGFGDVRMGLVYLRNPADYETVRGVIAARYPSLPLLYLHAPVCRPTWLVEMECIALTPESTDAFPVF